MVRSLLDILRIGRLHTALVTAAIPSMGCIAAGGDTAVVLLVAFGSMMHHGWGFSLNEIMDLEIDRANADLSRKPLVTGAVSMKEAHLISLVFLFLSFISFGVAAYMFQGEVITPVILLAGSTLCGAIYDIRGKRFPLSDILMAGWMFLLVLSASSAAGGNTFSSNAVWAVAMIGALQILFNNSVEGGLKDVANDREAGTRTLAVVSGSTFKGNLLNPGPVIRGWGISLRTATILISAVFSYLIAAEVGWGTWIVVAVSILGISVFIHSLGFLFPGKRISRKELIRTFAVHEMLSFALLVLTVLPAIGIYWAMMIFIAPFIWYFAMNRAMFETGMTPGV